MQVGSVSSSNYAHSNTFKGSPEEEIFARLKDRDIRQIAWKKASIDVNDKKHRNIDRAIICSLPLAGGIAAAAAELPAGIGKSARITRLGRFGVATAMYTAGLLAVKAVWDSKDFLAKKSQTVKNFVTENPVISTLAALAVGFAAIVGVNRGGNKLITKAAQMLDKKGLSGKVIEQSRQLSKALNESKILNKASEFLKKVPAPIKEVGKVAAEFAPWIVIGTQFSHSYGHQQVKANVASKNYDELKEAQAIIRQDLAAEKAVEHAQEA